jgi:hypothetical protein
MRWGGLFASRLPVRALLAQAHGDAAAYVVRDCDTAQAVELVRALRDQLDEMITG